MRRVELIRNEQVRAHDPRIAAHRIGPAWTLGPTNGVMGLLTGSDVANEGVLDIDNRNPGVELGDDEQVVLYIGRSSQLAIREHVHIESARWMDFAASSTVQRYETLDDLMDAERERIAA